MTDAGSYPSAPAPLTRTCGGCRKALPLSSFHFSPALDRYASECKACSTTRRRVSRQRAALRRREHRPPTKRCAACDRVVPMADFIFPEARGEREYRKCGACRSASRTTVSTAWRRAPLDFCTMVLGVPARDTTSMALQLANASGFLFAVAWHRLTDDERRAVVRHIVAHPTGPVPACVKAWLDNGAPLPGVTP